MSAGLLTCPFCGGVAEIIGRDSTRIQCGNEQCIIGDPAPFNDFSHRYDAITAWNTRAPPSDQEKLAQDVIDLVIAAREAWERNGSSGDDMDKALEAFSSRIPYNDEPATTITRARKGAAS